MVSDLAAPPAKRILVLSNCQTGGLAACLNFLMPNSPVKGLHWHETAESRAAAATAAAEADVVLSTAPKNFVARMVEDHGFDEAKLFPIPILFFKGFHPDLVEAFTGGRVVSGVTGAPYQSAIGVWCWRNGIKPDQAQTLFTAATMRELGYDRTWAQATARTRGLFAETDVPFGPSFLPLQASGRVFMHTYNHPTISFIAQLARTIAGKLGATDRELAIEVERLVPDALSHDTVWPVYPGVGEALGVPTSLIWKYGHSYYDLPRYLDAQFAALDAAEGPLICAQADAPHFDAAMRKALAA